MARGWFAYIGNNSDRTLAGSYVFVGFTIGDLECPGNGEICAIYAVSGINPVLGVSHPNAPLTSGILSYINVLSPSFPINLPVSEAYLYVRNP